MNRASQLKIPTRRKSLIKKVGKVFGRFRRFVAWLSDAKELGVCRWIRSIALATVVIEEIPTAKLTPAG